MLLNPLEQTAEWVFNLMYVDPSLHYSADVFIGSMQ